MKRLKLVLGIGVLLVVLIVVFETGFAHSVAIASPASDNHVMLEIVGGLIGGCEPDQTDFVRLLPDGTSGGVFRVPSGKLLIITDVDWQYNLGGPDQKQTLRLSLENFTTPFMRIRVAESTITLNSSGQGGTSEHMTTGLMVSSAAKICVDASPGGGVIEHVILRGRLIPNI